MKTHFDIVDLTTLSTVDHYKYISDGYMSGRYGFNSLTVQQYCQLGTKTNAQWISLLPKKFKSGLELVLDTNDQTPRFFNHESNEASFIYQFNNVPEKYDPLYWGNFYAWIISGAPIRTYPDFAPKDVKRELLALIEKHEVASSSLKTVILERQKAMYQDLIWNWKTTGEFPKEDVFFSNKELSVCVEFLENEMLKYRQRIAELDNSGQTTKP